MSNLLCKIFDHKWREGWAGAKSSYLGTVVVNARECKRCGKKDYVYTTPIINPHYTRLPVGEDTQP